MEPRMSPETIIDMRDLTIRFRGGNEAVSGVDLAIRRGEVVALVGESGSGKTLTALSIGRLLPVSAIEHLRGSILFNGEDLMAASESRLRDVRGSRIAYVFQEPGTALNPVFTAGYQIAEAIRLHRRDATDITARVQALLADVGMRDPARVAAAYPHQLSGGQQQRVMIAMALACEPDVLIADEPTTALDVTVQAQILDLLKKLQQEHGLSLLLITHNLAVAGRLADRIAVMYAGQVVESGPAKDVMSSPRHPYTRALLDAVPRLHGEKRPLSGIPGQIPTGTAWPTGCRFHPRCPVALPACRTAPPPVVESDGRTNRCVLPF